MTMEYFVGLNLGETKYVVYTGCGKEVDIYHHISMELSLANFSHEP